jgi:sulfite exporter TauE/SafE
MLASINPLGERGRNQSYPITAAAYVAASTAAAALLGGVLGAVGAPFSGGAWWIIVIALLAVAGLLFDARVLGLRVPGPHRQVNEDWLAKYRGWVYGGGFGAQLGFGFATIITASTTWIAFACALASGSAVAGALIGAVFGLARALPILATARTRDHGALRTRLASLDRSEPRVARVVLLFQATIAAALLLVVVA